MNNKNMLKINKLIIQKLTQCKALQNNVNYS